ncbi:hypothetical protein HZA43_02450 [Candidatus Peregrinibacteria bacterium]|nr:hypothetical protein [Candidatus Peregrinibacteria bacterium]
MSSATVARQELREGDGLSDSLAEADARAEEIKEAREWIAAAAALVEEDVVNGKTQSEAFVEMTTIWHGMDAWKMAAVIDAGDLHRLPDFVTSVALEDRRSKIQEALRRDLENMEKPRTGEARALIDRERRHLCSLGLGDNEALRERARATSVSLFDQAKRSIVDGMRPPLVPDEVRFGAFVASRFPTPQAIQTLIYFARTSQEIANALLENPLLRDESGQDTVTEIVKGLLDTLLPIAIQNKWGNFLTNAYRLGRARSGLDNFCGSMEATAQEHQDVLISFIGDHQITDETIRDRFITIAFVRAHAGDPAWNPVFMALRASRYNYFFNMTGSRNTPKGGQNTGREIERVAREKGNRALVDFLKKPFRTGFED